LRYKNVCVIGLGYIGLPTAATIAAHGVHVVGVDVNQGILETLRSGKTHIREEGLLQTFQGAVKSGRLEFSAHPTEADAFLIAVPTPFHNDEFGNHEGHRYKRADLRAVVAAAESLVPHLRKGNLVLLESTSPPRTTKDLVAPILGRSGLQPGVDFHVSYSPERVLPGQIMRELTENARVVGGITPDSAGAAAELYRIFVKGEIIETDATTAEMVKLMENSFRDTNIAIANEFLRLADHYQVDVWEAIRLANRHPRVKILNPGPGVGGHCISVDPWFLVEGAPELTPLIQSAREVNDSQPRFLVELIERTVGKLSGIHIAALGLTYKPNVDDVRESPALEAIRLLKDEGAIVTTWEPNRPDERVQGTNNAGNLKEALADAAIVLLLVPHDEFIRMTPGEVAATTPARTVVDSVNAWDHSAWEEAGFRFIRLGGINPPDNSRLG
jgi:UDP-N-acetyl-D-mannosaminuronic acid dehydrogenase